MKTYKCPFCGEHPRVVEQGCACLTESCPMFCKVCNVYDWNNRLSVDNPKNKPQIQWTSDPPTVEGWYWCQNYSEILESGNDENMTIVYVTKELKVYMVGSACPILDWKYDRWERSTEPMEVPE